MATHDPKKQNEALRFAARETLAARAGVALDLRGIRRRIDQEKLVDFTYTDDDLRAALAVLISLRQVAVSHSTLGATEHFQATAEGILAFERGQ